MTSVSSASPIADAPIAMAPQKPIMISPAKLTKPNIMAESPATIIAALADKAVANAVIPADSSNTPAPIPTQATANRTIEALKAKIVPTSGFSIAAATPITANAPAIANSPFPIEANDMLPKLLRTGTTAFNAIAMTRNAAEDLNILLDRPANKLNPATSANSPPIAAPALASSPHSILPNS